MRKRCLQKPSPTLHSSPRCWRLRCLSILVRLISVSAPSRRPVRTPRAARASRSPDNGNSANEGQSNKNKSSSAVEAPDEGATKIHGNGNIHAKLAGLNSLNRNINGLMNSSDPRMVEVRTFIQASADLAAAEVNCSRRPVQPSPPLSPNMTRWSPASALTAWDAATNPDAFAYDDTSVAALEQRLADLNTSLLVIHRSSMRPPKQPP